MCLHQDRRTRPQSPSFSQRSSLSLLVSSVSRPSGHCIGLPLVSKSPPSPGQTRHPDWVPGLEAGTQGETGRGFHPGPPHRSSTPALPGRSHFLSSLKLFFVQALFDLLQTIDVRKHGTAKQFSQRPGVSGMTKIALAM